MYVRTHFCQGLSRPQGHSAAGRIWSTEKSNDLIGNRTRDLQALFKKGKTVKPSLEHAVEARRVVRRQGSHIFLDNRLTDGGEVVSFTRRPPFTPSPGRFLVLISVRG
jgi:hypothetical protein